MSERKLSPTDRMALVSRLKDLTTNIDASVTALHATGLARSTLINTPHNPPNALYTDLAAVLGLADATTVKLVSIIERLEAGAS